MASPIQINSQISALIREDWGRLLAVLYKHTGDLALAEDCLQDAVVSALDHWSRSGLPDSPAAWLLAAARRRGIDRARRAQTARDKEPMLALWHEQLAGEGAEQGQGLPDHRLELIFTCCHPALDDKTSVALTLRTLGGLSTEEIAAAFLDKPATMAARLTRGKKKLRDAGIPFKQPEPEDLPERLDRVLAVLYLIFNEGYRSSGSTLIRADLAEEAARLGRILVGLIPEGGEVRGLLALMLLSDSRRLARTDASGAIVPLEAQNRARWDRAKITEGLTLVDQALSQAPVGPYALQAAINALHARAESFESTDWRQIVALYELLLQRAPNPVVAVNHAVALSYAKTPALALAHLEATQAGRHLQDYQPYHACRADLLARMGQRDAADAAYARALSLTTGEAERAFLTAKRDRLG